MKKVKEKNQTFKNQDWGPKYFFRGPHTEWGIIVLNPGQNMGIHYHQQVVEDFFFLKGAPKIIINDHEERAEPGDAIRAEPLEKHDIVNDTEEIVKLIFIKSPYLPEDKTSL